MVQFNAVILKFDQQGEKTGWSYIKVSAAIAGKLKPDNKRSFRVKGLIDEHKIQKVGLIPMGEGDFILAVNATIRKAIRKKKGDRVKVQLELDNAVIKPPDDLMECLADEPSALKFFKSLNKSHQNYFGTWVRSAKTEATRTRRIVQIVNAMAKSMNFGEMVRALKQEREDKEGFFK